MNSRIGDEPRYYGLDSLNPGAYPEDVVDDVIYRSESAPLKWHPDLLPGMIVVCGGAAVAALVVRTPLVQLLFWPAGLVGALLVSTALATYSYLAEQEWERSVGWLLVVPAVWGLALLSDVSSSLWTFYFVVFPWLLVGLAWVSEAILKLYLDYLAAGAALDWELRESLGDDWHGRWHDPWHVQSALPVAVVYSVGAAAVVTYELGWPAWLASNQPGHAAIVLIGIVALFFVSAVHQWHSGWQLTGSVMARGECWQAIDVWLRYWPQQPGADGVFVPTRSLVGRWAVSGLVLVALYVALLPAASFFPVTLAGGKLAAWRNFAPAWHEDESRGAAAMSQGEVALAISHRPDSWLQLALWGTVVQQNEHAFFTLVASLLLSLVLPPLLAGSVVFCLLHRRLPYYRLKVDLAAAIEERRFTESYLRSGSVSWQA